MIRKISESTLKKSINCSFFGYEYKVQKVDNTTANIKYSIPFLYIQTS